MMNERVYMSDWGNVQRLHGFALMQIKSMFDILFLPLIAS